MFLGIVILVGISIAIGLAMLLVTPKIAGTQKQFQMVPNTSPTMTAGSTPYVPVKVNKEKLIIQQNPMCWWGVPGMTCDPKIRTYA